MLISDLKEKKKAKIVRKLWNNFFSPHKHKKKFMLEISLVSYYFPV